MTKLEMVKGMKNINMESIKNMVSEIAGVDVSGKTEEQVLKYIPANILKYGSAEAIRFHLTLNARKKERESAFAKAQVKHACILPDGSAVDTFTSKAEQETTGVKYCDYVPYIEENKMYVFTFKMVIGTDEEGNNKVNVIPVKKSTGFPKNTKAGKEQDIINLVQANIYLAVLQEAETKKALVNKNNSEELSAQQEQEISNYNSFIEQVQKYRNNTGIEKINQNERMNNNNVFSLLICCDILNLPLPVECGKVKTALLEMSAVYRDSLLKKHDGKGTKSFSEDEQVKITNVKKSIIETVEKFCAESDYSKPFILKMKNDETIDFYEMSSAGFNGNAQGYSKKSNYDSKNKFFDKMVVKYFLGKILREYNA